MSLKKLLLTVVLLSLSAMAQLPAITLTATPETGLVPLTVKFTVDCPTCFVYAWDFGDGTSAGGSSTQTHVYKNAGTFYPLVAVADMKGQSGSASKTIVVTTPVQANTCPTTSIWSVLTPGVNYYTLPAWMTTPGPTPLTWVQPGDMMYLSTQFTTTNFNITGWTISGGDVTFKSVNTLGLGETVTLTNFQVSKFFNNKVVEVLKSTPTEFTVNFPSATGSSDHGVAKLSEEAAIPERSIWFIPVNSWSGGSTTYCQYLLAQGGTPPYTYTGQNLPPGLTVTASTGLYGGNATTPGVYKNIIMCVADAAGTKKCLAPRTHQICDGGKTLCNGFGN